MAKRRLASVAVAAGLVFALAPLGTPTASAGDCGSQIVMFFYYGAEAEGTVVTHPSSLNAAAVACTASDASGLSIDIFYVLPGSTFVKARHTGLAQTSGTLSGIASYNGAWGGVEHPLGGVFAETPHVALDPTASGVIIANAGGASQVYRTIDQEL